ncbi:MAG: hypothetical protein BWX78_01368 [Firmicutes bacterium ADurb.Bin099]|nr:MAG: hypothetical protein BWX78_01368 [Firmicutes bacterium ADurb.Bin099]
MKTVIRTIDLNRATMAELRLFISQAGKQANQRLRQLEQSKVTAGSNKYQYVKRAAFKDNTGMYGKTKKGEIKFNLNTRGLKISEMRKRAANIQKFIEPQVNKKTGEVMADTSTVAGVKAKYKKAEETIKKATGAKNISIDDVAGLVEMSLWDRLSEIYGPSEVMLMYAKFKEKASGDTSISAFEHWLNSKGYVFTDEETAPSITDIMDNIDTEFTAEDVNVTPEENPYMTIDPDTDIPF